MTERVERLEFWVDGVPIPQGSHSASRYGSVYDSNPKLKPWRKTLTKAAVEALAGRSGFTKHAEISLLLDFYMPRGSTVKRRRPNVRPDADKLTRAVGDSLTTAKVYVDDGQVVTIHVEQWYADDDNPGVRVVVKELA